ncbi:hypothetical protein K3X13_01570 [Aliiroseovarius crassostreae]|uniref:hypothetical protein n=1 Tax=Aliiroseovarius crassostreae TaxID=154981 RepID=UPI0022072435|nr:hypothetical protein [Aliiroseovarius crassostreae]UWP92581.1 hypothetical protein K3X13_01570 [Aliiroseovarius crassostreae]
MKTKWISIKRLKMHEFDTTLRRMNPNEQTWLRKLEVLCDLENKAILQLVKFAGQILAAYLIVTSLRDNNLLSISLFQIKASIPVAYFLSVTSFLFLLFIIAFNQLSVAMSLRVRHGAKLVLPGFSVEVLRQLKGYSENSLGIPLFMNSFIKEKLPISNFLSTALLMVIFSLSIPFIVFGGFILNEQLAISLDAEAYVLERISCGFGAFSITLSILYLLLFHIPFPVKKDAKSIRWGVLWYLAPVEGHPREADWLDEPSIK